MTPPPKVVIVYKTHPQFFIEVMKEIKREVLREQMEGSQRYGFHSLWNDAANKKFDADVEKEQADRRGHSDGHGLSDGVKLVVALVLWAVCFAWIAKYAIHH